VLQNRVLRRIFGLKRDEMTGDGRKHPNENLRNLHPPHRLYYYGDYIKNEIRWPVMRICEMRNAYRILVEKHEWKRQLGRPKA
jgi:hypothetical protein